jgi:hypothetical protein
MNTSTDYNPISSNYASSSYSGSGETSSNWFFFSFQTWIIIILILSFLGINVFIYLGNGIEQITTFLKPILKLIGYATVITAEQTGETAETGVKAGAKASGDIAATGLNVAAKGIDVAAEGTTDIIKRTADLIKGNPASSSLSTGTPAKSDSKESCVDDSENLQYALNDSAKSSTVVPDTADSSIQGIGKAGWCFIGKDKDVRKCAEVGVNDDCMSGDIFPTKDLCMNPNIRK